MKFFRNPFKKKDETLSRLQEVSEVFAVIEKLMKSDLFFWDTRHRRLFIASPVATVYMSQGVEAWTAFLNNIFLYVSYLQQQEHWDAYVLRHQRKAVADARKKNPALTKMDVERINRAVVVEMGDLKEQELPIEAFEFYVVAETKEEKAQTTVVGSYDPDTQVFNMVAWEEIQRAIAMKETTE